MNAHGFLLLIASVLQHPQDAGIVTAIELRHVHGSQESAYSHPDQSLNPVPRGDYTIRLSSDGEFIFVGVRDGRAGKYTGRISPDQLRLLSDLCRNPVLEGDLYPDYSNPKNPIPGAQRQFNLTRFFGEDSVKIYRGMRVDELSGEAARNIRSSIVTLLKSATEWKLKQAGYPLGTLQAEAPNLLGGLRHFLDRDVASH